MKQRRPSPSTLALLEELSNQPGAWRYGYDLSKQLGIKSGTLYPMLIRLADRGLLETRWSEPEQPGRPPRHLYRLSAEGQRYAADAVSEVKQGNDLSPAFEDAGR